MKQYLVILIILFQSIKSFSQDNCEKTEYICQFENAKSEPFCVISLYIENEKISKKTMLKFTNLKKVYLINCNSKKFLNYAWKISTLEIITINNNINKIPLKIKRYKNIRQLIIFNSNIRKIPKSIEQLDSLRTLQINYSKINSIPKELYNLKKLKLLTLSNGELKSNFTELQQEIIRKNLPLCTCEF